MSSTDLIQIFLGSLLVLSAIGILAFKNPVHASLSFLTSLILIASLYLQLSAQFIAAMQVLVYAGAILVLFMFVIVLFQDAHRQISLHKAQSAPWLIGIASVIFVIAIAIAAKEFLPISPTDSSTSPSFGTVQQLGKALYIDFALPFEAVLALFLTAIIGALYIGKKAT